MAFSLFLKKICDEVFFLPEMRADHGSFLIQKKFGTDLERFHDMAAMVGSRFLFQFLHTILHFHEFLFGVPYRDCSITAKPVYSKTACIGRQSHHLPSCM